MADTTAFFRKPFWSEPIEDDGRLLCTVRYIHANPAAADVLGRDPRKGCTTEEAHLLLAHDFNVRQVERITGVSRYRLQKAS